MTDHTFTQGATLQEGLNAKIAAREPSTVETLDRYQKDVESLTDHIVPLGKDGRIHYAANGHVQVIDHSPEEDIPANEWTLHPHGSSQLGERLGIPGAWLRDRVAGEEWERAAAAELLERFTQNTRRQRLLFRAVNNELRGVLSDSYKRLDSLGILKEVFTSATAAGAKPISAHYTDTRFYCEFLNPKVIEFDTPNNGRRYQAFGIRVQNSDFGDGALDVRFFMIEAICINGAIVESAFRQIHLGGKLPDNLHFAEDTYRADSLTTQKSIRDITRHLLSEDRVRREIERIQNASGQKIDIDTEMKKLTKGMLGKGEAAEVVKLLSNSRAEDGLTGEATKFKLSQAVGSYANVIDNPTRARELQEVAGQLLGNVSRN